MFCCSPLLANRKIIKSILFNIPFLYILPRVRKINNCRRESVKLTIVDFSWSQYFTSFRKASKPVIRTFYASYFFYILVEYCGFISIHCILIFIDFVVKLIHEIKCSLRYNFNQHFVLIWSLAANLRNSETVVFTLLTKIDTHGY